MHPLNAGRIGSAGCACAGACIGRKWRQYAIPARIALLIILTVLASSSNRAEAQDRYTYRGATLRSVLDDVGERANQHFLYRDALIAGKRVSIECGSHDILTALGDALRPQGIRMRIDSVRRQILLLDGALMLDIGKQEPAGALQIRGVVMDDEQGARLPYATVTWREDGRLRGTAANEAGAFDIHIQPQTAVVELTVSYVGYRSRRIGVDTDQSVVHLPVRLEPETSFGPEVLVSTSGIRTDLDTTWHHLLQPGLSSPLGASSVIRSLQTLPSVSVSPAASSGLNVRGSRADGFQVLLDGMSVYNQNHFFGLFDAFNEDVLQTVGLYYGVAPATLQGQPGGTLSFATRTGSQSDVHASFGLNNTSGRASLEGPLFDGRGSWLVSGRRSYLNAVDWFNNAELIGLGLDVGRTTSPPGGPVRPIADPALVTGNAWARFHDLHAKLFYEWRGGARLMLSGYAGGDATSYDAVRLVNDPPRREPVVAPAVTANDWGGSAASARFQVPVGTTAYGHSVAGFSRYRSAFSKDDFIYTDPTRTLIFTDTSRHVIRPFSNDNELLELMLAQQLDISAHPAGTWSLGYSVHRYEIRYAEASVLRSLFAETRRSGQLDLFSQYEGHLTDDLSLLAGIRSHLFTLGRFFRLSPRLRVRLLPNRRISIGAGFSRNYQFIHRLYVEQSTHADIWVMSTRNQPPGSVDHVTAGLYFKPGRAFYFQIEAYGKRFENLREHEASAARRRLQATSPLLDPWLHDNEGLARGVEMMGRMKLGPILWTNSYTLSRMDIRNDRLNGGEPYPADWDRRHQFTTHLHIAPAAGWQAHVVWTYAGGAPNTLIHSDPREPDRLSIYHRLDVGMQFRHDVGPGVLEVEASVYNLYDRSNTWYRAPIAVVGRAPEGQRVGLMNVDVFDLGLQPSLGLAYRF